MFAFNRVLYENGCLTSCDEDAQVTELGRVSANMPVDLPLVRLMLLGRTFGCVNDAIVMAAALSLQVCNFSWDYRNKAGFP
jgi:HrpA-like RNA helicase